jgi:RNA polymerase sigma-70 factor (ECF subfamily)
LLLHDVFDFEHEQIAHLLGYATPACRKLLERARQNLAGQRPERAAPPDEHRRLLQAFVQAAAAGDTLALQSLLADDAVMITDGGPRGRSVGRLRNVPRPLHGRTRIAAFVAATAARSAPRLTTREHELNGQPAVVFWQDGRPFAALLLQTAGGKIQSVFFHADEQRLRYLGDPAPQHA